MTIASACCSASSIVRSITMFFDDIYIYIYNYIYLYHGCCGKSQ